MQQVQDTITAQRVRTKLPEADAGYKIFNKKRSGLPQRSVDTVNDNVANGIGWASSAILLLTLGRQVYSQWKSEEVEGVSRWLFIGQLVASIGFTTYSLMLKNWVFFATNSALIATAVIGELIYLRNRRRSR